MKILQLNVWSCNLTPAIVELINREQPDVICFQEVISAERTGKILQSLEEMLEDISYKHVYYSPLAKFRFMHGTARRGNAILSKYPLEDTETFWTHGEFCEDFDYTVGWNAARGVACATVVAPGGKIRVMTTHGYHVRDHKNGNEETLKACRQIADYVAAIDLPLVLTGDFNLTPQSESMQVFDGQLRNLTREYGFTTTRNHLTSKTEACDYILTRGIDVEDFSALDDVVSDHQALVVNFS